MGASKVLPNMQLTACLMVSVLVSLKSLSVRSCPPPAHSDAQNTRCFIADNVVVDGTVEDLENKTTWTVVDATEGTVLIQFPFLNSSVGEGNWNCPTRYTLTLKVKDGQDFLDHSEHTVWVTNKTHSTFCDKVANLTFTHMYTGTYELHINVGCYCWLNETILFKNITTNYKKKFTADEIVGSITPLHEVREVRFTVNVDTSMIYTLKYANSCASECKTPSDSTTTLCQWKVFHGVKRIYKNCIIGGCEYIENAYPLCDWGVVYPRRNDTETSFCGGMVKGDYSEDGKQYDITVHNVSTGCYCITAEHWDSRVKYGVWNNVCQKTHSPFIYVKPGKPGRKTQVFTTLPLPLTVTLCILLLFSPVIMWMLWKYLRGRVPETEKVEIPYCNNLKVIEKIPNAEILLLYPHDCDPFMKLMKDFKELLKITCKCEVLDYYDQEHSAEIDKEGSSWLLKKINSPATKIILVESTCSVLCQQAHFNGITIKPVIQHCRDSFFTLALVELASNKHTVFVIRFNLKDEVSFKCISRDVRYVMPYQLRKLVTAMGFYISEDVVQINKGMEMVLINNINCFINYANENKNYIMDLYKKW